MHLIQSCIFLNNFVFVLNKNIFIEKKRKTERKNLKTTFLSCFKEIFSLYDNMVLFLQNFHKMKPVNQGGIFLARFELTK